MDLFAEYVKPELLVLAVVLYLIGIAMKKSRWVQDRYIPIFLGGTGIFLAGIWIFASCSVRTAREAALAVFTAIVQGILVAGLSTYVNQTVKQLKKGES